MTAVRAAAMLAVVLSCTPAHAQTPSCEGPPPAPRKSSLGGLFAAARDAGLGQALFAGIGSSAKGQAAAAILSGDAAGAVDAIPGANRDARTTEIAGALAGVAMGMAQSARSAKADACPSTAATGAETPATAADVWR